MLKNRIIKLFLILGVILFSLVGVVGCSNSNGSDNVNATYIEMSYPEDAVDNEFTLVNNHLDLLTLLKNDAPEKYNDSFFELKSLLIFKITEPSGGNKSEIESYEIIDKTLNVYVKTKQYGIAEDVGCWVFILELRKDEVNKFDGIRIFKDGEEIIKDTIMKTKLFYTLQEAYTNSLLSIEDLEKIASYHNNGQQAKEKINNDIANEIKIRAAHIAQNEEAYADLNITAEDFAITKYYGAYDDCVVFMIKNLCFESPAEDLDITDVIAGVEFYYSSTDRIMVWKI